MSVKVIESKKIRACGKDTRIPMSLSNYLYPPNNGGVIGSQREFKRIINSYNDARSTCDALNSHKDRLRRFRPYKELPNGYVIIATDTLGNEDLIYITEEN